MRILGTLALLPVLSACVVRYDNPSLRTDHPGNPQAAEAQPAEPSHTLDTASVEANAEPAPSTAAQHHEGMHHDAGSGEQPHTSRHESSHGGHP